MLLSIFLTMQQIDRGSLGNHIACPQQSAGVSVWLAKISEFCPQPGNSKGAGRDIAASASAPQQLVYLRGERPAEVDEHLDTRQPSGVSATTALLTEPAEHPMKKILLVPLLGSAMVAWLPLTIAREVVVLPGVVGPVGVASGVDTQGPGTLAVGSQNINTGNDPGGAITTSAANTASVAFSGSSLVTGFVGTTGATFLNISAGTAGNTVTFSGPVFSTTFSVAGTGTVNFNGGFTSNTGSTMDFAGDGFINVGAGQTVKAAITNTAGADTGTLTLNNNSVLDGAVGAASGLKQINVVGGNALITGQVKAENYTLGTNTLNVAGAFAIPVAGTINTTIFSQSLYGHIVPVGAATIGNALLVNVTVTGPIANGSSFNIVDATSGTNGSTVTATSNTTRYLFSAAPTANGIVKITATQVPLAVVVGPVGNPVAPIVAPVIDALPVTPATAPLLTAITLLPSAQQVASALAQLQPGAANLASPQTSYRATQQFQQVWASHMEEAEAACGENGTDDQTSNRSALRPEDDTTCQPANTRPHFWGAAFGYSNSQSNANGYEGYNSSGYGAMLDYDIPLNTTTTAGVGVRYARSNLDGNASDSQANINSYQATAYLGYAPGPWFANIALVYGVDDYMGTRQVDFAGVDNTAQSDYSGHQVTAFGSTGYHFYVGDGKTVITPLATLQYTRLDVDNYAETGGNLVNLNISGQSYDLVQSGLGVKIARDFTLSDMQVLSPELHVNWLHSFGNDTMSNTAAFATGGPTFTALGVKPARDIYDVGAGLVLASGKKWSLNGDYDYQWGDGYRAGQAMLKFTLFL